VAELEVFLAAVDALNDGEVTGMEELLTPDFVFHPIRPGSCLRRARCGSALAAAGLAA
jgi:hypothetical protein